MQLGVNSVRRQPIRPNWVPKFSGDNVLQDFNLRVAWRGHWLARLASLVSIDRIGDRC